MLVCVISLSPHCTGLRRKVAVRARQASPLAPSQRGVAGPTLGPASKVGTDAWVRAGVGARAGPAIMLGPSVQPRSTVGPWQQVSATLRLSAPLSLLSLLAVCFLRRSLCFPYPLHSFQPHASTCSTGRPASSAFTASPRTAASSVSGVFRPTLVLEADAVPFSAAKLAQAERIFDSHVELVFVNAVRRPSCNRSLPHMLPKLTCGPSPALQPNILLRPTMAYDNSPEEPYAPEDEPRSFWHMRSNDGFESDDELDRTLYYLRDVLETHGTFDGILGFSQGAATAAILCALVSRPWLHPAFSSPSARSTGAAWPPLPFKFAILCSGYLPLDRRCESWFDTPVAIPALHVIGRSDVVAPNERTLANVPRFTNSRVEWHEGGCAPFPLSCSVDERSRPCPSSSQPLHPPQALLCAPLQRIHPLPHVPRRRAAPLSLVRHVFRRHARQLAVRALARGRLAVAVRRPAHALAGDGAGAVTRVALSTPCAPLFPVPWLLASPASAARSLVATSVPASCRLPFHVYPLCCLFLM